MSTLHYYLHQVPVIDYHHTPILLIVYFYLHPIFLICSHCNTNIPDLYFHLYLILLIYRNIPCLHTFRYDRYLIFLIHLILQMKHCPLLYCSSRFLSVSFHLHYQSMYIVNYPNSYWHFHLFLSGLLLSYLMQQHLRHFYRQDLLSAAVSAVHFYLL